MKHLFRTGFLLAAGLSMAIPAIAGDYLERPEVQAFVNEVAERNKLDKAWVQRVLAEAQAKESIVAAMTRPAEKTLTWNEYRALFVTQQRITWGKEFMTEHEATLVRAEETYGVPAETIAAIIGVETYYGRNVGSYRVLDALATLGFDYAPRAPFFRGELEQFLLMTHEQHLPPTALKGSYAGAMGLGQFIPSSYRNYAVDFNGDGVVDLWNVEDAIGSVARYFAMHGWQTGQAVTWPIKPPKVIEEGMLAPAPKPTFSVAEIRAAGYGVPDSVGDEELAAVIRLKNADSSDYWLGLKNFYVITRYNHSPMYAMAVYQLSQALAGTAP
ncbi:MAG TPA: lytic murein transglycosylase B [Pseudomonadales bacterium]